MLSESESLDLIESALGAAEGDECDAVVISSRKLLSRFAGSNLHQNSSDESASLAVRVVLSGGRMASPNARSIRGIRRLLPLRGSAARSDPAPASVSLRRRRSSCRPRYLRRGAPRPFRSKDCGAPGHDLATDRGGVPPSPDREHRTSPSPREQPLVRPIGGHSGRCVVYRHRARDSATHFRARSSDLSLSGLLRRRRARICFEARALVEPVPPAIVEPPPEPVFEWMNLIALSASFEMDRLPLGLSASVCC